MIRNKYLILSFVFACSVVLPVFAEELATEIKDSVVSVKKAFARTQPNFLSQTSGVFKYGDRVRIIGEQKGWYRIEHQTAVSWLHSSAVSAGYYILKDIGQGETVSKELYKDETVTAGKGFSPEYEKIYKTENPKLDYDSVDRLEQTNITKSDMKKFARQGGLNSAIFKAK